MDNRLFTFAGLISTNHDFITIFYTIVCAVVTIGVSMFAVRKMQAVPTGMQNFYEWIIGGMLYIGKDTLGDKLARKYFPLAGSIGVFVFFCNVIGIIPGFEAPTASISFTLVLALIVFFYYHFEGIRANGFGKYFGHFAGPIKLLSPLLFPIEIISHCSRIVSLSFRLFGNIKGDDMFLLVMLTLVPWVIPLLPFAILMFMAILQAFVFMILTYVYLASAVLLEEESLSSVMNKKIENRKILAMLDFFYGFFFGVSIFAAVLAFIVTPYFFPAILTAVCIFSLFLFLSILVKYFRVRLEISQNILNEQIEIRNMQEKILHAMQNSDKN